MFKILIRGIQSILYVIIQIIFIPFLIIGLLIGLYKEMIRSKKYNVSFSAGQALQYRWMMHYLGTREDYLSVRFIKKFPCESNFALLTTMGPFILAKKLFAFTTKLNKLPEPGYEGIDSTSGARVIYFDQIMEKYIDQVDQVVLPGAGFDLITLKYTRNKPIKVFELDQSDTLNMKVQTLKKAHIDHEWVHYIPVDYSKESWKEKLIEAGFDQSKTSLFLWQSVSLYLEEEDVKKSLRDMSSLCNEESIVVQDLYSKRFASGAFSKIVQKNANLIGKMGEVWKYGLDLSDKPSSDINNFLKECHLETIHINQFGRHTNIEPYYFIVEAKKLK